MTKKTFSKVLSANDVGATGGHQGGILVPKSETELLEFLPYLDPSIKNPDAWIECVDENREVRRFRFVYYNNRLHDAGGTRNEYRITYMTQYLRSVHAREGDTLEISKGPKDLRYAIQIVRHQGGMTLAREGVLRIKISSGWRRVH